jgi:hypothetical protein
MSAVRIQKSQYVIDSDRIIEECREEAVRNARAFQETLKSTSENVCDAIALMEMDVPFS